MEKYKIPANCKDMNPSKINNEIWNFVDKPSRSGDCSLQDVQKLVALGMVPIIKLAEILKGNFETEDLISNSLMMLGNSLFEISIRRRHFLHPSFDSRYHSMCTGTNPIVNSQLFGNDIAQKMKSIEEGKKLCKLGAKSSNNHFLARTHFFREADRGAVGPVGTTTGAATAEVTTAIITRQTTVRLRSRELRPRGVTPVGRSEEQINDNEDGDDRVRETSRTSKMKMMKTSQIRMIT